MSRNSDLVTDLIRDFGEIGARVLVQRLQLAPDLAADLGLQIAAEVCREHEGINVYIPKRLAQQVSDRDRSLYAEFQANGRNAAVLARKHGVSVHTVYRRLRLVEAQDGAAPRQKGLFPSD